ncbi:hypothetical protein F0521_34260 [Ferrimonas sp. YFM]|nr:hypothetical protein F0521_34260 [Ferrimonas sp. YFM]
MNGAIIAGSYIPNVVGLMRVVSLFLSGLLSCYSVGAFTQEIDLPNQNLRPFTLHARGVQLTDQLPVYLYRGELLLPLQGLAASLGIDVKVDPQALTASGWIQGENANLMLDLNQDKARRGLKQITVDPEMIWGRDNLDIYLTPEFIQQLLPLTLNIQNLRQTINASGVIPMPAVDQAITLNQVTADPNEQKDLTQTSFDPQHPHDYQIYTPPLVYLQGEADLAGEDYVTEDYMFNLLAQGDLAMHSYEFSAGRTQGEDERFRLRVSRDLGDLNGWMPFQLGGYQVGDVRYFGDNLIHGQIEGQGVVFGNAQQRDQARFGRTVIEGNAPEGWSVNLYRNGALMRVTTADQDNHYQFTNLPLVEGSNLFELHLFGPNGEYLVRRRTVHSGGATLAAGQVSYSGFYIDQTSNLFTHKSDSELASLGLRRAYDARVDYGLTDNLTLGVGYSQQSVRENGVIENRDYFSTRATGFFADSTWFAEAAMEAEGDSAFALGWQTLLGTDHSLRLTHNDFGEFQSSRNNPGELVEVRRATRFEIEGALPQAGGLQYQFGTAFRDTELGSGFLFNNRLSTQVAGLNLTHYMAYDTSFDDVSRRLSGQLLFDTPMRDWNLSGHLNYQTGEGIGEVLTTMRWRPWRGVNNQTQLYYRDPLDSKSRFGLGHRFSLTWQWLTVGLEGEVNTRGDWQVLATSAVALNYQDGRLKGVDYRPQLSDIQVRVFEDINNNGRFDPSDRPLAGLPLLTAPGLPHSPSDDTGLVKLTQVPSNQLYRISVEPEFMPSDLVLRDGPAQAMPVTGKLVALDLPLVRLTDLEGRVLRGNSNKGLSGIPLVLKDLHRQPLATLVTGPRGEYRFDDIKPGYYLLQPDPTILDAQGVLMEEPLYPVAISGKPLDHQRQDIKVGYVEQAALMKRLGQAPVQPQAPTPKAQVPKPRPSGVMAMDPKEYTLQLAASRRSWDLTSLKKRHPSLSLSQLTVLRNGKPMYLLLSGRFPTERSAQYGLRDIPKDFANDLPLVRSVSELQAQHQLLQASGMEPLDDQADWVAGQPQGNLTWQIAATRQEASARQVVQDLNLGSDAHIHFSNGWYQVLWGSFTDRTEASEALTALAKAPQSPWLRSLGSLR